MAAAASGGAAGSGPVVEGAVAGDARRAWPAGRVAGGEGVGEGRRWWCWTLLESEMKRSMRQQETHLRRSPDPAEKRGWGQSYITVSLLSDELRSFVVKIESRNVSCWLV